MGFILSILALILFILMFIIYFIFNMFFQVKNRKWYKLTSSKNKKLALNIDIFGNYVFKDFWNTMLSKGGYSFGRLGETLSSCLGKKLNEKSLNIAGYILAYAINIIDITTWFKGGHCHASIQTDEEIMKFINE